MLQVSAENVALTRHKQYPATPLQPWAVSINLRRGLICPFSPRYQISVKQRMLRYSIVMATMTAMMMVMMKMIMINNDGDDADDGMNKL